MPKIRQINKQIADGALVEFCQLAEVVERGGMPGAARPHLPVREHLERLQLIRPTLIPFVSGLALAPLMGVTQSYPGIEAVALPEGLSYFYPRLAFGPQRTHQLLTLLLLTTRLTHNTSSTSQRLTR
jgi:hypothetical protein